MNLDPATVAVLSGLIVILCGMTFILNTVLRRNDFVGRLWSIGFVAGMLMTLAETVTALQPTAWWAVAVSDAAFVVAIGFLGAGLRAANGRASLYWVALLAGALVAGAVLVHGPDGGPWAGAAVMFLVTAVLAIVTALETLRDRLRGDLNARVLTVIFSAVGLYYLARMILLLAVGFRDRLFIDYFGTTPTTTLNLCFVIVATITLVIIQADRFEGRAGRELRFSHDDLNSSTPELAGVIEAEGLVGPQQFRAMAETWLRRAVREHVNVALILTEIANFDAMGVAFGPETADSASRMLGRVCVTESPLSALVGRMRRHRFAILLPFDDDSAVELVAERINTAVLTSRLDDADRMRASTFVAITSTRAAGSRYDDLMDAALGVLEAANEGGVPGTVISAT